MAYFSIVNGPSSMQIMKSLFREGDERTMVVFHLEEGDKKMSLRVLVDSLKREINDGAWSFQGTLPENKWKWRKCRGFYSSHTRKGFFEADEG